MTKKKKPVAAARATTTTTSAAKRSTSVGDGADAQQQLIASRVRAGLFALFTLLSLAITSGSAGVEGKFAFWVDKVGGTDISFSVPVILLWAAVTAGFGAMSALQLCAAPHSGGALRSVSFLLSWYSPSLPAYSTARPRI